jgi:hypothetical protein
VCTCTASLFHFVFEKFLSALMDNDASVTVVCSCLNCVLENKPVVYVLGLGHCRCVLKIYRALSLVDAIRERARKCKCRKQRTLPPSFCCRKRKKVVTVESEHSDVEDLENVE